MRWFYRFCRRAAYTVMQVCFGFRAYYSERVPKQGGLIIAPNHASHLDPPAVALGMKQREIHFMARSSLLRIPGFGALIRNLNTHPIERGQGPFQDWDQFIRIMQQGGALLIFPEGTRSEDGTLQRGKSGFARLVHMSRMPVYPAYIKGSFEAWPKHGTIHFRRPVAIYFGPAVPLDDLLNQGGEKRTLREISNRVMTAITALKQEIES